VGSFIFKRVVCSHYGYTYNTENTLGLDTKAK